MNLSFTLSCKSMAFWWAIAWRGFLWGLLFAFPIAMVLVALKFLFLIAAGFAFMVHPFLGLAWGIITMLVALGVQYLLIPIFLYALALNSLFKKARFGKYTIAATYKGQPVHGFKSSLRFSGVFVMETLKYTWPSMVAGFLLNFAPVKATASGIDLLVLTLVVASSLYSYFLCLKDILSRRELKHFTLEVDKAAA